MKLFLSSLILICLFALRVSAQEAPPMPELLKPAGVVPNIAGIWNGQMSSSSGHSCPVTLKVEQNNNVVEGLLVTNFQTNITRDYLRGYFDRSLNKFLFEDVGTDVQEGPKDVPLDILRSCSFTTVEGETKLLGSAFLTRTSVWFSLTKGEAAPGRMSLSKYAKAKNRMSFYNRRIGIVSAGTAPMPIMSPAQVMQTMQMMTPPMQPMQPLQTQPLPGPYSVNVNGQWGVVYPSTNTYMGPAFR